MQDDARMNEKERTVAPAPSAQVASDGVDESAFQGGRLRQPSKRVIADSVMVLDFIGITAAALISQSLYISGYLGSTQEIDGYLTVGLLGAFVAVAAIRSQDVYRVESLAVARGQGQRLLFGLGVSLVFLVAVGYMLKVSADFSRGWVTVWFSLNAVMLVAIHFVASRILRRWKSFGLFARKVVVYGSGEIARKLLERVGGNVTETRVIGVYDDLAVDAMPSVVLSGGLSDLIRIGQAIHIDEVIIALPMADKSNILNIVAQLSVLPTNIQICPDLVAFQIRPIGIVSFDGVPLLEIARAPMDNWAPIIKTVEDRVLAFVALVMISPVMLAIALAVKLDGKGPVFFRQRRHGFNHQVISVLKFRSMVVTEDGKHVPQATRNDPRITKVGRILRRTSLDELPQLFNVLKGEMSLVGPRPHAIAHNEHYSAILETYASRHKVKPGITGWAQINGYRGETDTPEKMRKRVECDLYYIENWSLWFDIRILALTLIVGLFGKNAF
tara:strand:- start:2819 stop:4318 length:1500 start_codon:yes stop_codon:yes gene_type:complete